MRGKWDTCCALQLRTIRQNENNGVCAPVEVENQAANSILHGFQSTFGSVRKKKEKRKRRKKEEKKGEKSSETFPKSNASSSNSTNSTAKGYMYEPEDISIEWWMKIQVSIYIFSRNLCSVMREHLTTVCCWLLRCTLGFSSVVLHFWSQFSVHCQLFLCRRSFILRPEKKEKQWKTRTTSKWQKKITYTNLQTRLIQSSSIRFLTNILAREQSTILDYF